MRVAVLIPAYRPAEPLLDVIGALANSGVEAIVVVDDGSGPAWEPIFERVREFPKVHLLRHATNLGKGAALKTGMEHVLSELLNCIGVITADADGQHHPDDILSVARTLADKPDQLVLGARLFDGPVPLRSRVGNAVTRTVFRTLVGQDLQDTQTGLRGVPRAMIPDLLRIDSNGYEFELDMLLVAKHQGRPVIQRTIRTIYEPGNKSSHFNPLLDSLKTYAVLLRFTSVSIVTALLDNLVFFLAYSQVHNILVSQVAARSVAIAFQFTAARRVVFLSHGRAGIQFAKFLSLALAHAVVSYAMIRGLVDGRGLGVVFAKPLAEGLLFIASFVLQREFVFSRSSETESLPAARVSPLFRIAGWLVLGGAVLVSVWGVYSCGLLKQDLWFPLGLRRLERLAGWYVAWSAAFLVFAPAWFAPATLAVSLLAFGAAFGPMAVVAVLLFLFSCVVTGALLLGRDETPDPISLLLDLLLGVAVWMGLVWIAVHFRVNYAATYVAAFCVPLAVRPRLTLSCLADCARLFRPVRLCSRLAYGTLALAAFPLLCQFLVAAAPEDGSDAVAVHLMAPLWVGFQHYWPFDFHHYSWTMMPLGADWCYTAVVVPGGEYAAHLLNFAFLAILTGLVYLLSRRYLAAIPAMLLAGLFASSPLSQLVTGSLFSENVWAAVLFGAILALERFHATGAPRWFYLAAVLFGAGLATKFGTTAFLFPAAGFAVWELVARRRALPNVARVAAIGLLLLLLFGGPPYVYSWAKTGNPLFPYMNEVFKSPWFDSSQPFIDLRWQTPLTVHTAFDIFFHTHRFLESQDGAVGFQYLLLVPLGLLALSRRRTYLAWLFLGVALIGWILTFHTLAYVRYLYPALPLLAAASAVTLGLLHAADRALFRAVVAVLLVAFALNIYFLPASGWSHRDFFVNPFSHLDRERSAVPVRKLIAYLNQAHPRQPVALFETSAVAGLRAESYRLAWHNWPYMHQVSLLVSPAEYGNLAQSLGIQYFVAPRSSSGTKVSPPLVAEFLERATEPEYSFGSFEVRRLKQGAAR